MSEKICISDMTLDRLTAYIVGLGQPKFRAKQIFKWLHQKLVTEFAQMTDQPKTLLSALAEQCTIAAPSIRRHQQSRDGTVKYLLELADGNCIETVLMRYKYGNTVCVSTQVGCAMGCRFCASTQAGRVRDLTAGEIASEIYTAQKDSGERVSHIVLMGIGEPLHNFDNVMDFLEIISCPEGVNIGMRNISLSTCGLVPKIDELAKRHLQLTLSVSLHAPDNRTRSGMMPVNDAYPLEQLIPACRRYQKETGRRISFDPRDGTDNGLTVDRAQELGEQFCKEHFPGHQALICTHPDGHNHSGNIHVHIVINSLRIYEVPLLPYMDRPADTLEGCKHRCTNAAMEYFKSEVMEMCHREGLYQIDLLNGSKERITEREYWAAKKGQLALDKENAAREAAGQPTKPTKFETDKAKLRRTIRQALSQAASFDEFSSLLLREGVTVKESRGRLSYLTPDRTKPITARKLGDDFDKAAVLALLTQNAHRAAEKTVPIPEYHTAETNRTERGKTQKIAPTGNIQRMVDRAAKRAEGKGIGYDRWAAVHNLKQMAATVAAMEQYGFTPDELDAALVSANADLHSSTAKLKPIETAIREKKDLQKQVLAYAKTRDVRDGLKKQKTDKARKAYREKHESDFIIADAAVRYFRQKGITKLPTYKSLQAEIEQLTAEKNALYNEYRANKERVRELQTMKSNLSQMHHGEPSRQKKHEQER